MNELALFTGAGGGLLGTALLGWRPVCGVESDPFCREVLLRRQRDGLLPLFPIWDDVRTFDGTLWTGLVDVLTGGFPCQPWSLAGKREGEGDERNLWPETLRVIREVRPPHCLLENVAGLRANPYFGRILEDLSQSGYRVRWDCIPASACGAPHRRDRLWILAQSECPRLEGERLRAGGAGAEVPLFTGSGENVAHAKSAPRRSKAWVTVSSSGSAAASFRSAKSRRRGTWWSTEPRLGRVAHGVAHRVDRLRALGNGQVPAVVQAAWRLLNGQ